MDKQSYTLLGGSHHGEIHTPTYTPAYTLEFLETKEIYTLRKFIKGTSQNLEYQLVFALKSLSDVKAAKLLEEL
jgi:hypothetical protein